MNMNKGIAVEVNQVGNGFLVTPTRSMRDGSSCIADTLVFQSFSELTAFLAEHFTFRATEIKVDAQK